VTGRHGGLPYFLQLMRTFLTELVVFALLQTAMLALLFWQFADLRKVSPLMPAVTVKHDRLASAPSPRMILIGGSNLLFGIDSRMIEQQTGYHPVNMGLMRSLRLDYILNEVDSELRAGDLVIISLEYSTLNGEAMGEEGQVIMGAMTQRLASAGLLSWEQCRRLLDQDAIEYLGVTFRQAIANISERDDDEDDPDVLQGLNEYGDLTRFHDPTVQPRDDNNDQTTLTRVNVPGVEASIRRLNEFIASCRTRGVEVMYAAPPICRTHYQQHAEAAHKFEQLLTAQLDAPVACAPADMVFDDAGFLGRSYHLRGPAVQQRTQRLIDAVTAALADNHYAPISH
jgi:hypothetical protein